MTSDIEERFNTTIKLYTECENLYTEIEVDISQLKDYESHLQEMYERGFKVKNALQRLGYQIQLKEISFDVLKSRKLEIMKLFKSDMMDLTKILVQYTPSIDSAEHDTHDYLEKLGSIETSEDYVQDIMDMKRMALARLDQLKDDIQKYDPEIDMAERKISLKFKLGDIVNTLKIQKEITQKKFDQYVEFYSKVSSKHHDRTIEFIKELQEEKDDILNDPGSVI